MDVQIPMRARPEAAKTKINAEKRRHLYGLVQHPGYAVLLEMMEVRCVLQDATLLGTPNGDHAHVIAQHAISVAMWEFFGGLQAQVKFECGEAWAEMTPARADAPPMDEGDIL